MIGGCESVYFALICAKEKASDAGESEKNEIYLSQLWNKTD